MNELLRARINRKLDTLSDERLYQVLDYVEFLESRYAERTAAGPNVFQRFAEGVEDTMRAGRISAATISETMTLLNRAMGVLSDVAAAGKSVASDVMTASRSVATDVATASRQPTRPAESMGTSAATVPGAPSPEPASEPQPASTASTGEGVGS